MGCPEHGVVFELAQRETRLLSDFRGMTLRVTRGTLWVTQQDDTRDHVLRPGDCWMADRDGLTIVEAQEDATVVLPDGASRAWAAGGQSDRRASRLRHRLDAIAQSFFATRSRGTAPYY